MAAIKTYELKKKKRKYVMCSARGCSFCSSVVSLQKSLANLQFWTSTIYIQHKFSLGLLNLAWAR